MSNAGATFAVLGIGNVLLADDGIGVHVVREIERRVARGEVVLPPGTWLLDGGTRGPDLAPFVADAAGVVIVDALDDGGIAGSVAVLDDTALDAIAASAWPSSTATADIDGLGGLLSALRLGGRAPGTVALVGIRPAVIDVGLDLSAPVAAALPRAVAAALDELHQLERTRAPVASGPDQAAGCAAEAAA
jgi:hydrogenase maturation protease